jgi:transposase-like protein
MAHKHHPKEARIRAVQQQDGGRPASDICKDMNITPGTLKRWRDQLHLLAPSDAVKMRDSLEREEMVPFLGLWRIMETWPFKNDLRQQIIEAEYEYERLK